MPTKLRTKVLRETLLFLFGSHMELLLPYLATFLFSFLLLIWLRKGSSSKSNSSQAPLPPGPWKLPIIGSMHHLVGGLPFRVLHKLATRYGPMMYLKVGQVDLVVVSCRKGAEQIMKAQDANFASRPQLSFGQIVAYNCVSIGFSPYGSYWTQLRKLCAMELLSAARVKSYSPIRMEEVPNLLREVAATPPGATFNVSKRLLALNNGILSRAAFGAKVDGQDKFLPAVKDAMKLLSGMNIADYFPTSRVVRLLSRKRFARLKAVRRRLDEVFDEVIREHEVERAKRKGKGADRAEDLVDVLLRVKEQGFLEYPITYDTMKAVILEMFIGGTETSSTVIEWAMSELIRHPEVIARAQQEVREALKGKARLEESDVEELKYLKSVVKEALRLHIPAPLLVPRVCKEETTVLGYKIPTGAQVLVNAWALARDPNYWEDAESFKPERFDNSSLDYKGTSFEYLPFGAGRRICPGVTFGLANLHLDLAYLLCYFDWKLPDGMKPEELDMAETFGASKIRRTDLCLVPTLRIPLPTA